MTDEAVAPFVEGDLVWWHGQHVMLRATVIDYHAPSLSLRVRFERGQERVVPESSVTHREATE